MSSEDSNAINNFEIHLNKEQKNIVTAPLGPILVVAAAGTGKTRILTERIIHLINNGSIKPESILAITFTNMAAEEMKQRINIRLKDSNQIPESIGTIHSIFGDILRRDIEKICPYRQHNFEILQEEGQNWAIRKAFQSLKIQSFCHKTKLNNIRGLLSEWKTGKFLNSHTLTEEQLEKYEALFLEYEKVLQEKNLLDFDDVLILATQLLSSKQEVMNYWSNKYQAVLIDEVQDLNEIQWRLVQTIIKSGNSNFLAVGDPNQCIYLFNRAKENIFDEIELSFSNLMVYELTQNYRSSKKIVQFSNEIKHIKRGMAISKSPKQGIVRHCKEADEAIQEIIKTNNYGDWAILFPKHSHAKQIIELLIKNCIPFKISRFYLLENTHIEQIIKCFRAIFFDNSQSLENLICSKQFCLSPHAKKTLLNSENWPYQTSFKEFLLEGESWKRLHINSQDMTNLNMFVENFKKLKNLPQNNLSLLVPAFKEFLFSNSKITASTHQKIELFEKYLSNIQPNHTIETSNDIVMNLYHYSEFSKTETSKKNHNAVTLSTVHKAKGLEWKKIVVLQYGLLEQESKNKSKDKHLAYVAATRAKESLFLIQ